MKSPKQIAEEFVKEPPEGTNDQKLLPMIIVGDVVYVVSNRILPDKCVVLMRRDIANLIEKDRRNRR